MYSAICEIRRKCLLVRNGLDDSVWESHRVVSTEHLFRLADSLQIVAVIEVYCSKSQRPGLKVRKGQYDE